MFRKNIVWLFILVTTLSVGQNIRHKMMHMQSPSVGRYKMNILPWAYDSTVSASQIARCVDSLPGHAFNSKMYNILYKDDSTKQAVKVNEGSYLFHKRITEIIFWKNGNKKSVAYVNKHYEKYWEFSYYENDAPCALGQYKKGHKVGKWKYFNTRGLKVKVEKYAKDGTVEKTKIFDPPKKCLKTMFNSAHPGGSPYIII
jgi:hypothetical protein